MRLVTNIHEATAMVQAELAGPLGADAKPLHPHRVTFEHDGHNVDVQWSPLFMTFGPPWVRVTVDSHHDLRKGGEGFEFHPLFTGPGSSNIWFRDSEELATILLGARMALERLHDNKGKPRP